MSACTYEQLLEVHLPAGTSMSRCSAGQLTMQAQHHPEPWLE